MAEALPATDSGFRAAHATGEDWGRTVKACVDALEPLPAGANLGFLYATDSLADDLGSIVVFLRERTGIEDWVGTVGLGVSASGIEHYEEPALSILVGAFPEGSYKLLSTIDSPGTATEGEVAAWAGQRGGAIGVVHGDPRNQQIADIVRDFSAVSGSFLIGGLSASRGGLPQVTGRVTEGGLSGVLFTPETELVSGLTQGCSPIGPVRHITKAADNVIMEIDDRPALEVFKEDIGELLARDLRRVAGYIFVAFPITGSDTGDYLVRNLVAIDPAEGWLGVGEEVAPGQSLLFCRRDQSAAEADLDRMLTDVARRAQGRAKAGLYFSCIARGTNLFGSESEELKQVREALGDIPLVGFFANGEISNDRLYGYTGVIALFL